MNDLSPSSVVILVGHGAPPSDFPRDEISKLKALEGRRRATGAPMSAEERALDEKIRHWPRTDATDPYRAGMTKLAAALAAEVAPRRLVVAYNEFCAPSLDDAIREEAARGATRIDVVPSMLTPGGVHSEVEIPETIAAMLSELPHLIIRYAWPFDMAAVARLLCGHLPRD